MEPEAKKDDKFELIFTNGALANLKALAKEYGIPEDKLGDVVNKGIKLLSILRNTQTKTITLDTKNKQRFVLDAENI